MRSANTILFVTCCAVGVFLLACSGATTSQVTTPSDTAPAATEEGGRISLGDTEPVAVSGLARVAIEIAESGEKGLPRGDATRLSVGSVMVITEPAKAMAVYGDVVQFIMRDSNLIVFAKGINGSGIVTGQSLDLGLVHVVGVQRYTNVLGAQTSGFIVRCISDSEWRNATESAVADIRRRAAERIEAELAAIDTTIDTEEREWTDSTGSRHIAATLMDVKGDFVLLKKDDGAEVSMPLDRLSEVDGAYVRRRAEMRSRSRAKESQLKKQLADLQ